MSERGLVVGFSFMVVEFGKERLLSKFEMLMLEPVRGITLRFVLKL